MNNIPIYRAKKIDSDEYVVGNYIKTQNKYYIYEEGTSDIYLDDEECFDDGSIDGEIRIIDLIFEIDATTLSIHFPDMIDSQGNKIFASLSEDGKGGDILDISGRTETIFINESIIQTYTFKWEDLKDFKKIRLGIQE